MATPGSTLKIVWFQAETQGSQMQSSAQLLSVLTQSQ